jgi:hypothetical protein
MTKKLFLVFVLLLAATAAVAATSDSSSSTATAAPAIRTYLMPDLSFKTVLSLDMLPQAAAQVSQADGVAAATAQSGFCACGCGIRCTTSADCGGNACRPFITCCARKSQNQENDWFTQSFESSSHKTPLSGSILKAECK